MKFKPFLFLCLFFAVLLVTSADTSAEDKKAQVKDAKQLAHDPQPVDTTQVDTEQKGEEKETSQYGEGERRCLYGCCQYVQYGRCRRCCRNAVEALSALIAENQQRQTNQYRQGRCRYGCCSYGKYGRCRRCCMNALEAETFQITEENELANDQNFVADKDSDGNGNGYGSGGGGYGGGSGSSAGGGEHCRLGCCGYGSGDHGGCNKCCASTQEAKSFQNQAKP